MKRIAATVAAGFAVACAPVDGTPGNGNASPPSMEGPCDAAPAQRLIGRAATAELGAEALRLTSARTIRWIRPGDMVTMDFRPDRLNIDLDGQGRVSGLRCG